MLIGAQYYRPPFPDSRYWDEDLSRMRDAGLNVVQLWACWGWIEPEPGEFRFDDYDRLIKKAGDRGLKVVISTIAEIQPFWMERKVPEGVMIDHMGRRVISGTRGECIVGVTPGGCTDHPEVKEYMVRFLREIGSRYGENKEVLGWDCWNETRWNVQADGYVCYCPATLKAFRDFLRKEHKDLDGLNRAWGRRYTDWADVFPGKLPGRVYTELMEFMRFLTWRAGEIMRFRAKALKDAGVKGIISAHCGAPSILSGGWGTEQALCRGNDWDFASSLDGYGCSHFPFWGKFDDTEFGIRVEAVRSAVQGKILWVSELQGGAARDGLSAHEPVRADAQQRWVWNSYGRGAKAVIFWCWRDEVFSRESGGFGIAGNDGLADERLKELSETAGILQKHEKLLDMYQPCPPSVGVFFEPCNYYLEWAQYEKVDMAMDSLTGYLKALERLNIPYEVVESGHPEVLDRLKFLILPFPLVLSEKAAEILERFVRKGGILLAEGDMGAFDTLGFYRYPGTGRKLADALGISPKMERQPVADEDFTLNVDGRKFRLKTGLWISPMTERGKGDDVLARDTAGRILAVRNSISGGTVYGLGTFLGINCGKSREFDRNFAGLLKYLLAKHGCLPEIDVKVHGTSKDGGNVVWRHGISGSESMLFVINPTDTKKITFECSSELIEGTGITDIKNGKEIHVSSKTEKGAEQKRKILLDIQPKGWNVFLFRKTDAPLRH